MLTALLIFLPLIAVGLLMVWKPGQAGILALGASLVELVITLVAVALFESGSHNQFVMDSPWVASLGINFYVGMDGISLLLVLLTTLLTPLIILSSFRNTFEKPVSFYSLILFMEAALVGVFVSLDGFVFYIFWEMALIPIYFICLRWGGVNRGAVTLKFFIYTLAGSLIMLVAFLYLYYQTPLPHSFSVELFMRRGNNFLPALRVYCSGQYLSPSPSRCRCSRFTRGNPILITRRRHREPCCSRGSCSRWESMA